MTPNENGDNDATLNSVNVNNNDDAQCINVAIIMLQSSRNLCEM